MNTLHTSRTAIALWLIACALTTLAHAQFESAMLTGVVTDPAGAVVAKAEVKITNEATNTVAATTTDSEGRYTFSNLRPGSYRITISSPGFKQAVSSGLVLPV